MARVISITANIHGSDLGTVMRQITKAMSEAGAHARTKVNLRGQTVPLQDLLNGFRSGLLATIVVIFLMLAQIFNPCVCPSSCFNLAGSHCRRGSGLC